MKNDKGVHVLMPSNYHISLKILAAKKQCKVNDIIVEVLKNYLITEKAIEA